MQARTGTVLVGEITCRAGQGRFLMEKFFIQAVFAVRLFYKSCSVATYFGFLKSVVKYRKPINVSGIGFPLF